MSDCAIYELMYPYCRGELLALVTRLLTPGRLLRISMLGRWNKFYPQEIYHN